VKAKGKGKEKLEGEDGGVWAGKKEAKKKR